MKTKFLPVLLIISVLLVTADKTCACINDPPNAYLYASPNTVCVGTSVTLDGRGSSDPDGVITKYEWDFTNNGSYDYYETSSHYPDGAFDGKTTHIYTIAGTYTAKLRVTDDNDPPATGTDTCQVTVVKVDRIEINYSGSNWDDVTGETIVVLKGTKYTFKAFPDPSGASWPSNKPNWSGVASETGETIEATFGSSGSTSLTAKCGSGDPGKMVSIDAVVPEPNDIYFVDKNIGEEHDIYGVDDPVWKRVNNPDDPACYTKGKQIRVRAKFWAAEALTYNTEVEVDLGTGSWAFAEDTVTFYGGSTWPSESTFHNSETYLNDWAGPTYITPMWKYKVPSGTDTWIEMGTTGAHTIYKVLAAPTAPMVEPWEEVLEIACDAAAGQNTEQIVTGRIWYEFYYNAGGVYDTIDGSPGYIDPNDGKFKLTDWLSQYGSVGTVNCHDMAQAVVIFSNALGCNTTYTYVSPFGYLNCIHPIGCGWTNNPFYDNPLYNSNPIVDGDWSAANGRSGFGNHGFARLGSDIFDASGGQVDVDDDPDGGPPHTARSLDGDDTWTNDYRDRVIDDIPSSSPGSPTDSSFDVK